MSNVAKTFNEILVGKFNPYHDRLGRFTTAGSAASFTYAPGKSKAHDMAIAREKERTKNIAAEEEAKKPGNRKLNLNQDAIKRADSNSLMGNTGTALAKEAQSRIDSYKERNKVQDDWTDEQKAYAKQREDEYTKLIEDYYNDQISRRANNVSWAVAGPANFNHNSYNKKDQAMRNKAEEYEDKIKNFETNTKNRLKSMEPEDNQIAYWRNGKYKHGEKIDPADPLAAKKYQAKIDYLTEKNEKSKAANKYWNKNHTMTGFDGFSEETNQKLNDQFKRIYSSYQNRDGNLNAVKSPFGTTNTAAEIRRNKQQLEQLQNRKASASSGGGGTKFNGGEVIRNAEANRLQIKFDGIPDAATRQKLKSSGWRWSPKNGVWQRQLTANAEYSANTIIEGLNKSLGIAKSFSELLKFNPYHDRLGRFASGNGFMNSSYTGDRSKQAITFSANPDTRAGALAIAREAENSHESIGRAYDYPQFKPKATPVSKPQKDTKKPEKKKEPQETKTDSNMPSPTNTKSGLPEKVLDTCRKVEAKTVNRKTEKMTVIGEDGQILLEKGGGRGSVSFRAREGYLLHGETVTHNHPGAFGGTFSGADVNVLVNYKLKAIRAVAKEGTYSLERTDKVTSDSAYNLKTEFKKSSDSVNRQIRKEFNAQKNKIMRGETTPDEANKALSDLRTKLCNEQHEYLKAKAADFGFRYIYEPSGGVAKMFSELLMKKAPPTEQDEIETDGEIVLDGEFISGDNWMIK